MNKRTRQKIVNSFLDLLVEHPWSDISLAEIAKSADIDLAILLNEFTSKADIFSAYADQLDEKVLKEMDPSIRSESAREQLLDVFMLRFEAMQTKQASVRALYEAAANDRGLACKLIAREKKSIALMMAICGIDCDTSVGQAQLHGLLYTYLKTLKTFIDDEDKGLARTMSSLDGRLRDGESWLKNAKKAANGSKFAGSVLKSIFRQVKERYKDRSRPAEESPAAN